MVNPTLIPERMEAPTEDDSWQTWFQTHGPRLLLCARQWTSRNCDAEDIVQEAFIRFWRKQRSLGGDALPLLLLSIRRAATDLGRRNGRRMRREEAAEADPSLRPESCWFERSFEADERTRSLEAALRELPLEQREVLVLKIWGELTFDQIARHLDIPANTAASRYRYGLLGIRKTLVIAP